MDKDLRYDDEQQEDEHFESPMLYDDAVVAISENAEKRIIAINKIKLIALKVTSNSDWVDLGGTPYLQVSGAEKIARLFGISWRIDEPTINIEPSGYFDYTYQGHFSMGRSAITAIGTRASSDPFFKTRWVKGEKVELPPSEVNRGDVKKSAYTNCIGNGVTRLLGIRKLSWNDLETVGIKKGAGGSVSYGDKPEMSADGLEKRQGIMDMLTEMCGGDASLTSKALEKITSFVSKDGKTIKGKSNIDDVSEKALPITYGRVKDEYEKWQAKQGGETK